MDSRKRAVGPVAYERPLYLLLSSAILFVSAHLLSTCCVPSSPSIFTPKGIDLLFPMDSLGPFQSSLRAISGFLKSGPLTGHEEARVGGRICHQTERICPPLKTVSGH